MRTYSIGDMTCGRCVGRITAGIRAVDPAAEVRGDVGAREVSVRSTAAADAIEAAIREAGYTPVTTRLAVGAASEPPAPQAGTETSIRLKSGSRR